jgi:hypothetical protein
MTRLNLLEDQKVILEAKKAELENKRGDIYVREQQAITDTIFPFFNQFTPEVEIEVTRGSVYFKMVHPDYSYKKELFNIYLRENWRFEEGETKKSFNGVDLSYYTTSTKGIDKWELKRLQLLGAVAEIVLEHQDRILDRVNNIVLPFKDEYDIVFKELQEVGKEIGGVEQLMAVIEKEKIAFDLKNGGVEFIKGMGIQLKFNYAPVVVSIKLIDLSKSGKKGTAVFKWAHGGSESREENINVSSIIDQVHGKRNSIVQPTLAE